VLELDKDKKNSKKGSNYSTSDLESEIHFLLYVRVNTNTMIHWSKHVGYYYLAHHLLFVHWLPGG
jgi:hypothetical protein